MERLKTLIGPRKNRVDFITGLITLLLSDGELYSDEVLFRDAVEEIYQTLRSEVLDRKRGELADAYETAVLLRAAISGKSMNPERLLVEIGRKLSEAR
ncbi:hypothetical protein [Thermococcus sp.]|uniref:hypothetical protein n=1 Tax=Thermococcus sp. TaxID=35749 RepID=UPI002637CD4D|nr:hypothetical protein [Thermococcus sp.]